MHLPKATRGISNHLRLNASLSIVVLKTTPDLICSVLTCFLQRRRRATKPTTPGTGEQTSPQTSPAKRGPKRAAPAPPRRPPLIPTFDEWRSGASTDRGAAGENDRPAASSSAESSPSRKISPNTGDTSQKSDSGSGSQSPVTAKKGASTDGGNQADIKQLARQLLMDARKKAGASGALPRERVAEIAKTSKGPTADKETTGSIQGETGAQEKKVMRQQPARRLFVVFSISNRFQLITFTTFC